MDLSSSSWYYIRTRHGQLGIMTNFVSNYAGIFSLIMLVNVYHKDVRLRDSETVGAEMFRCTEVYRVGIVYSVPQKQVD